MQKISKLINILILFTLFWELQDPTTAFVRAQVESTNTLTTSASDNSCLPGDSDNAQSHYSTQTQRFEVRHRNSVSTFDVSWNLIEIKVTQQQATIVNALPPIPPPDIILIYQMSDA